MFVSFFSGVIVVSVLGLKYHMPVNFVRLFLSNGNQTNVLSLHMIFIFHVYLACVVLFQRNSYIYSLQNLAFKQMHTQRHPRRDNPQNWQNIDEYPAGDLPGGEEKIQFQLLIF